MNARDRRLLFERFGGGTLSTVDWRDYASLSRLGFVEIEKGGDGADLARLLGVPKAAYRRVTITARGLGAALREGAARVEELAAQAAAHLTAERVRNPNRTRCLCGACILADALAKEHAAMGWP